jgi:hypothetical protein
MANADPPSVTFETELVTAGQKPVYHYLYIERELVAPLGIRGIIRRVTCTLNDKVSFPCSLMGNAKGAYKISVNKEHRNTAGIVPGDTCKVTLVRDDSEYGIPVPPELVEVLDQDPAAKKLFESLTNGRRRVIVWHVDKVKDTDERICRALIILEHVKNNCGEIDDKKLYEELKAGRAADRRT